MSTWAWISGKRERDVLLKSIEHLKKIYETIDHFSRSLDSLLKRDENGYRNSFKLVDSSEEEADEIKKKIIQELSRGYFHPLDREDLLRLILSSDDIAAYVKAAARKFLILLDIKYTIPNEILVEEKNITANLLKSVDYLIKSVEALTRSLEESISYTNLVEEIEEKIDDLRIQTLEALSKACRERYGFECALLKETIDDLEMASDKCEETGDIIRSIAISHM